jgi:AP-1 complex subunit gamma-1
VNSPPNPTGVPQVSTSNTQNLLDEIFGSSSATEMTISSSPTSAPATSASPPPKPRNAIDDILGLFPDSTSTPSPNPINTMVPTLGGLGSGLTSPAYGSGSPMPTPVPQSAFSLPQAQSPPQHPPQQRLTAYTAYEKNELKITLTPQMSPNRPGIVNVLARFQVLGQNAVSGLSFQVAVPKVRFSFLYVFIVRWVLRFLLVL